MRPRPRVTSSLPAHETWRGRSGATLNELQSGGELVCHSLVPGASMKDVKDGGRWAGGGGRGGGGGGANWLQ